MTRLPVHELASLSLFRATPAQVHEARKRTWPHWGSVLTEEQYLERGDKMETMEHAVNSKWITWVLAPRDNSDTLDFKSACETYKRKGLVRYSESSSVQEVTCYGVAYVFTPLDKRGKGYASHMMRLLHWAIGRRSCKSNLPGFPEEWGAPPHEVEDAGNGLFSILYSALGDDFYREAGPGVEKMGGWEGRHRFSTTWEIPERGEVEQDTTDDRWRLLRYEDLDAFWAEDVQFIRHTMEHLPGSHPNYHVNGPVAFVTCLPDEGVGAFHIFRSMFALDDVVSVECWGIKKEGDRDPDQPTYATWTVDTKPLPPVLVITRLSATEADFSALIKRIQAIARRNNIWKMEAWNVPSHLLGVLAKTGGRTFAREKRLPAIKWYGEGETADIEWIFNEKFCWC